ncbi:HD domain-containing phosphohydrolase [Chloroflexota bacterium]
MVDRINQTGGYKIKPAAATEQEVQSCKAQLEFLYDLAQKASSYADVRKLIEQILEIIQHMVQASASSLLLVDEEKSELYFQAVSGDAAHKVKQTSIDLNSGIAGWVARNGTAVIANNVSEDPRFNAGIDQTTGFVTESIIALPLVRGQKVIGVIEVLNKNDGKGFTEPDLNTLKGLAATEALILLVSMTATAISNVELRQVLLNDYKNTTETLVTASESRDPYSYGHSQRVRKYALMAAKQLSFSEEEMELIEMGALLHDIGKISIRDVTLNRMGGLTPEDQYNIQKHPLKGANIVSSVPFLEELTPIILYHHEWYDGSGYPERLKGENIPIGARLVAVAEAFDAMTTEHSHRPAMSAEDAITELVKGAGKQFCPVSVEAFVKAWKNQRQSGA